MRLPFLAFLLVGVALVKATTSGVEQGTAAPSNSSSSSTSRVAATSSPSSGLASTAAPKLPSVGSTNNPNAQALSTASISSRSSVANTSAPVSPKAAVTATPAPQAALASTTVGIINGGPSASAGNGNGHAPGWVQDFVNALDNLVGSSRPQPTTAASNITQSLGDLFSKLPGLLQGLGGVAGLGGNGGGGTGGAGGGDIGQILNSLISGNQNAAQLPGWIKLLTQGGEPSSIISNILKNMGSGSDSMTQAMLQDIVPDVLQSLQSLNLTSNSTGSEVLSAILSNEVSIVTSDLLAMAQQLLAQQLTNPERFPIDPTSTCAAHLLGFGDALQKSELLSFQTSLGSNITRLDKLDPRDPTGFNTFLGVMITIGVLCFLCTIGTIYGIFVDYRKEAKKKQKESLPINGNGYVNGGFTNHHNDDPIEAEGDVLKRIASGENVKNVLETTFTNGMHKANAIVAQRVNGNVEGGMVNGQNGVGGGRKANGTAAPVGVASPTSRNSEEEILPSKLLLSFSVLRNGRKLLDCTKSQSDISCLHGIRVISITWVILGHCFSMGGDTQTNKNATAKLLGHASYMVIPAGVLSVDTFFLLSGCLTSLLFLRSTKKSGLTVRGMILYYWHRYWRLTPFYGLLLAFYTGIFPYLVKGPFQNMVGLDSILTCRDYWYMNILYDNNLGYMERMCFGWSWYLSNDMQFYIIAPICLIPWALKGRIRILGFVMATILILTHIITTWVLAADGMSMFGPRNGDYMEQIYFKPWCRVGPYAVGLILGYILHNTRSKYITEKLSVLLGWLVATTLALTIVYILYENIGDLFHGVGWNDEENAAYEALAKVGWAICVSWVIFACCTGNGGFVNTFLSWGAWAPLSRMTYGVYLIHLIVLPVLQGNMKKAYYADAWSSTTIFLSVTVLSFLTTFVFSLLVEAPTLGLEKAVLGKVLRRGK